MKSNKTILSSLNLFQPSKAIRCSSSKISAHLSKEIISQLDNEEIKPRQHPGILKVGQTSLPQYVIKGIIRSVGDYPLKTLLKDGQALSRYLNARHPPAEESSINKKMVDIEIEIENKLKVSEFSAISKEELEHYKKVRENKIKKILKQRIFSWKPMSYGQYEALSYAVARSAQEYSILLKILKEIMHRNPEFRPRSYFDFGSGIGTGMWAASTVWKDTIFEYFNVDSSREMNDLSDLILREGSENQQPILRNVLYRQFLPAIENKYDLILSAFSLFELPSSNHRKEVLLNLWRKCDGYMILVEEGTRHAFELITEARNYILNLKDEKDVGHVFSPCPHDLTCPRLRIGDRTPCNFDITFQHLPFGNKAITGRAFYSYVVLKKGVRDESEDNMWPRVIRQTLIRSKHTICRMCTSNGTLQEAIFTAAKHGKHTYKCARSTKWGDRLPVIIDEKSVT